MRRRIKKATVKFLSLVPRGANKMKTLFKADDNTVEFQCLTKAGEEEGEILFCAYAPEHRDSQGDIASAKVIKDMAYSHAQNGGHLDVRHDCKPLAKEEVFLAENFIIQKTDERFQNWKDADGNEVNTEGGWGGVIKVEKEELRKKYRDGEWSGVSLYGDALVETEKSDIDGVVTALLEKLSGDTNDMKPEELETALKKSNEGLVEGIVKGIGDLLKKSNDDEDKKPDDKKTEPDTTAVAKAPEFKGDPTDTAALAKHAEALERWKLTKDVDMTDPEAVANLAVKLADLEKSDDHDDDDDDDFDTEDEDTKARVRRLEKENRQLRKRSNRRGDGNNRRDDSEVGALMASGLSKEDALLWERGRSLGHEVNIQRGFAERK